MTLGFRLYIANIQSETQRQQSQIFYVIQIGCGITYASALECSFKGDNKGECALMGSRLFSFSP